ncbi:MAG: hypothetical protein ACLFUU_11915 [Desulfobacteraceae bacterium]
MAISIPKINAEIDKNSGLKVADLWLNTRVQSRYELRLQAFYLFFEPISVTLFRGEHQKWLILIFMEVFSQKG